MAGLKVNTSELYPSDALCLSDSKMPMNNLNLCRLKNSNDLLKRDRAYRRKHAGGQRCPEPWSWLVCALVSMLVGSLSEPLACGDDRLSLQELGEDRPHVGFHGYHRRIWVFATVPVNTLLPLCVINDNRWRRCSIISGIFKPEPEVNALLKRTLVWPVAPHLYPIVLDNVQLPGCRDSVKGTSW